MPYGQAQHSRYGVQRRGDRGTYQNDGTTARGRWMCAFLQHILTCKTPMAPAEITHLIQSVQVELRRCPIPHRILLDANIFCSVSDPLKEFSMIPRTIGAEVL